MTIKKTIFNYNANSFRNELFERYDDHNDRMNFAFGFHMGVARAYGYTGNDVETALATIFKKAPNKVLNRWEILWNAYVDELFGTPDLNSTAYAAGITFGKDCILNLN